MATQFPQTGLTLSTICAAYKITTTPYKMSQLYNRKYYSPDGTQEFTAPGPGGGAFSIGDWRGKILGTRPTAPVVTLTQSYQPSTVDPLYFNIRAGYASPAELKIQVSVSWTEPINGGVAIDYYNIYAPISYNRSSSPYDIVADFTNGGNIGNVRSYIFYNVPPNTSFTVRVAAHNPIGLGSEGSFVITTLKLNTLALTLDGTNFSNQVTFNPAGFVLLTGTPSNFDSRIIYILYGNTQRFYLHISATLAYPTTLYVNIGGVVGTLNMNSGNIIIDFPNGMGATYTTANANNNVTPPTYPSSVIFYYVGVYLTRSDYDAAVTQFNNVKTFIWTYTNNTYNMF